MRDIYAAFRGECAKAALAGVISGGYHLMATPKDMTPSEWAAVLAWDMADDMVDEAIRRAEKLDLSK